MKGEVTAQVLRDGGPQGRKPRGELPGSVAGNGSGFALRNPVSISLGEVSAGVYFFGQGTPQVVFLHGLASSSQSWGDVPELLARSGIASVCVDLPGHGRSGRAKDADLSPEGMATFVGEVLDHLNLLSVHLVGHSLGGAVAMSFTSRNPIRVSSLTLIASAGLGSDVPLLMRAARLPGAQRVINAGVSTPALALVTPAISAFGRLAGKHHGLFSPSLISILHDLAVPGASATFVATVRALSALRPSKDSGAVFLSDYDPRRVTLITCEQDPVVPAQFSVDTAKSQGARLLVFEGYSHEPQHTNPGALVEEIRWRVHGAPAERD
jgi:pimeloyl-ACP methyl ester carboxylesterase